MKYICIVTLLFFFQCAFGQTLTSKKYHQSFENSFQFEQEKLTIVLSSHTTEQEKLTFLENLDPLFKLTKTIEIHCNTPEKLSSYLQLFNQLENIDIYSYSTQNEVKIELNKPLNWFSYTDESVEKLSIHFIHKDSLKILGINCPLLNQLELNASFFPALDLIDFQTPKLSVVNSFKAPQLFQAVVYGNFKSWPTFLISENQLEHISITNLTNIEIPKSLINKVKNGYYSDLKILEKGKTITKIISKN